MPKRGVSLLARSDCGGGAHGAGKKAAKSELFRNALHKKCARVPIYLERAGGLLASRRAAQQVRRLSLDGVRGLSSSRAYLLDHSGELTHDT
jgi:hypothetical protein